MKYKLTENKKEIFGVSLFQIQALKSFGDVKEGDLGGWIEKESNLSQENNCWVSGNARVSGNASVSGDAWVSGDARVFGNALVFGNARVSGDAWVCKGNHTKQVVNLILSRHSITVDGEYLNIGCKSLTIQEWLKEYKKIGKENGYTQEEIEEYGMMIKTIQVIYF